MNNTLRVLSLEDSEEDFGLISYSLSKSDFSIISKRVDTKEEFVHELKHFKADVILSDHSLPGFNSLEALKLFKTEELNIPFILVTGAVSDEFAVNCLKLGADDYILKSNLSKLPHVIENALRVKETELTKIKAAKDLEKRNEELGKLNKELDTFVYSVSHNLRSPLRSILGLLNIAKFENDLNVIKTYHQLMEKSIQKLDDNLVEILEYSRAARQELKIEEVNLKAIFEESFERMQFMPRADKVAKEIMIYGENPFHSDAYRLTVIINNLVSNSLKYSDPKKEISFIKISATVTTDKLIVEYKDNGIGIDKSLLPKVFNMFFRATEKTEGAGLGLYIVKEAIVLLGGRIEIFSTLGEGTSFHIEVPNFSLPEKNINEFAEQYLMTK